MFIFGYVMPVKSELKVKDYETYRSYYCGVCKDLQTHYGFSVRFLLNYDLVLLALIADSLSGEIGICKKEGCFANPIYKKNIRHATNGLSLASDGLILLSYHKICDNIADEKFLKRCGYYVAKSFLYFKYKKAKQKYPDVALCIAEEMEKQFSLENNKCADVDMACEPTAKMCQALFAKAGTTVSEQKILGRLGLFAGQIVYLLDACEDFLQDKKENKYNVFIEANFTFEQAIDATKKRCNMAAGEIALCYNLLNFKQNKDILNNIFFLGLPVGIAQAGTPKTKTGGHTYGQINSL